VAKNAIAEETPICHQAINGTEKNDCWQACKKELETLEKKGY